LAANSRPLRSQRQAFLIFSSHRRQRTMPSISTHLFLSISRRGSSFCRYFPEYGQFRLIFASCSNLGTGQVFLTIRGNVRRHCSLVHTHIRASTRRAVARRRPNSTVRYFPSSRPLTPGRNTLQKCPSHTTALYHPSSHLPHITKYHTSILDPLTPTPQYNLLPRSRRSTTSVNGYSTTRNVRGRRGLCVYVSSEILPLSLLHRIDADKRHVRLGRNQLHGAGQGIERLCKRC